MREEMVRERNKEIEAVINKLGDETHDTQRSMMLQYDRKCKEIEQRCKLETDEVRAELA
jgi:hypothetical protein